MRDAKEGERGEGTGGHVPIAALAVLRRVLLVAGGRRGLEADEVVLQLVDLVDGGGVRRLEVVGDGLEGHAVLVEEGLVLLEAVDELALVGFLLPPARGLGWHHAALDLGLDAVGTGLVLVTPNLALLAQDARVAPCQLHDRRVKDWDRDGDGDGHHGNTGHGESLGWSSSSSSWSSWRLWRREARHYDCL